MKELMSTQQIEMKSGMPADLSDKGWRLFVRDSTAPYVADNEGFGLNTGGFPTLDEALEKAREMTVEEEERIAIAGDGVEVETEIHGLSVDEGVQNVALDRIRTDGGTQPRSALDMLVVADYKEAMSSGAVFPPIDVFFDGKDCWLADGFHRVQAQKEARVSTEAERFDLISSNVHLGTQRDALLFSLGANEAHGLRRSREDKRRAVQLALEDPEWSTWSDNVIAHHTNVSQPFVSKMRRELTTQNVLSDQPVRTGTDGVARDVSHIGKAQEDDERQTSIGDIDGAETAQAQAEDVDAEFTAEDAKAWTDKKLAEAETETNSITEIVELLNRHGGVLYRGQLEEMGISYAAIHNALGEGAIVQPETGKFTLPDHKPQPSSSSREASSPAAKPKPTVEEILKGRKLAISLTWIPAIKGKVSVSVNAGLKPTDATRLVIDADKAPRFSEEILDAIHAQLKDVGSKPKVVKKAPSKSTTKKTATKKKPARKK
jgi:hypothetical protein